MQKLLNFAAVDLSTYIGPVFAVTCHVVSEFVTWTLMFFQMDWTECGSSASDPSLVTASGGDQNDTGQLEWPQSPSDVQPRRWQCPQETQQYTVDQSDDGRLTTLNSMTKIYIT